VTVLAKKKKGRKEEKERERRRKGRKEGRRKKERRKIDSKIVLGLKHSCNLIMLHYRKSCHKAL
jgi:hypothetical protein